MDPLAEKCLQNELERYRLARLDAADRQRIRARSRGSRPHARPLPQAQRRAEYLLEKSLANKPSTD